jgi:soluble lytic murein transglycosylase-like protein
MQSDTQSLEELRRLPPRLAQWALEVQCAASMYRLDPLVLAALLERESSGGEALSPPGPAGVGDCGHGRGLMQIDDRWHRLFVSTGLWAEPAFALLYGARLLRRGLDAFKGDYPAAIGSYNAGISRVQLTLASLPPAASIGQRIAAIDRVTTQAYVAGVLKVREQLAAAMATAESTASSC